MDDPNQPVFPKGCCAPSRPATTGVEPAAAALSARGDHRIEQVQLPGGVFQMGDALGDGHAPDGELPVHVVRLSPFSIDATSVTNDDFARFVAATGYRTEAEIFGSSAVFHLALRADEDDILGKPPAMPPPICRKPSMAEAAPIEVEIGFIASAIMTGKEKAMPKEKTATGPITVTSEGP